MKEIWHKNNTFFAWIGVIMGTIGMLSAITSVVFDIPKINGSRYEFFLVCLIAQMVSLIYTKKGENGPVCYL